MWFVRETSSLYSDETEGERVYTYVFLPPLNQSHSVKYEFIFFNQNCLVKLIPNCFFQVSTHPNGQNLKWTAEVQLI
ncbi:hypothetical protein MtrunA17_Chr1g0188081 [Medicago truncatula]|uniref:Uncharacterized protein n=1 Tax=Medicago truncatula TaxID=3880 RepID=A0A396JW26_MEDTR|nr:hypothetical protein MtrunA17_Chr1g0188081 [Medicago truncatula]